MYINNDVLQPDKLEESDYKSNNTLEIKLEDGFEYHTGYLFEFT